MIGYDFHPEARADLDQIYEYIAEDSPDAADRVISEILAAIRALAPFPRQGHKRSDLTSRPLRFCRVRDYLIAYAPEEKEKGRRDPWQPQSARDGRDLRGREK